MSHTESQQDDPQQEAFWLRTDEVITLANQQSEQASSEEVSGSLLYASARFNAFLIAASAGNKASLEANKEDAIEYFTEQYRQLLTENLDDYLENFDDYTA